MAPEDLIGDVRGGEAAGVGEGEEAVFPCGGFSVFAAEAEEAWLGSRFARRALNIELRTPNIKFRSRDAGRSQNIGDKLSPPRAGTGCSSYDLALRWVA
jgi:hypothetical protein